MGRFYYTTGGINTVLMQPSINACKMTADLIAFTQCKFPASFPTFEYCCISKDLHMSLILLCSVSQVWFFQEGQI